MFIISCWLIEDDYLPWKGKIDVILTGSPAASACRRFYNKGLYCVLVILHQQFPYYLKSIAFSCMNLCPGFRTCTCVSISEGELERQIL